MRLLSAIVAAAAYGLGRPTPRPVPGAASEPAIVEPWQSPGVPDEPDPIAQFILTCMRPAAVRTPAHEVYSTYCEHQARQSRSAPQWNAFLARLAAYGTIDTPPGKRPTLVGFAFWPDADRQLAPQRAKPRQGDAEVLSFDGLRIPVQPLAMGEEFTLRAVPGLRRRLQTAPAALATLVLHALQDARLALEPATDASGRLGDAVRMATAILDDALADAACDEPDVRTA